MGNWRFGAFPKLPYSTMQQLNLDWILDRIRRFLPDTGTKGQVLTRTKDGAAWVDPEAASGAVSSVNGKTGAVVLTASDVGALPSSYQAPVTSVNGMTGDVVISGGGAVDSVNGKTGEVVLTAADVGALPESYVPPAAPVQSVNGQTGAVTVPYYKRTLLWTNPTVGELAAGTVNVDMTGYDNIEIECTETGNPPQRTYYVKCPIGTDSRAAQCTLTTFFFNRDLTGYGALGVMSRYADIYLHGINFGGGDMLYNGTYYQNWNNRAVPYRIWGIKYQEE